MLGRFYIIFNLLSFVGGGGATLNFLGESCE